ncbi:putative EamA domain-containing protein [Helianthus anomalus]
MSAVSSSATCHGTASPSAVSSYLPFTRATYLRHRHFPKQLLSQSRFQLTSRIISSTKPYITLTPRVSKSDTNSPPESSEIDCVGTGTDVECVYPPEGTGDYGIEAPETASLSDLIWEWTLLISPFFFWGTAMVAMKEVLPKLGPLFVSSFRLVPSGLLLVAFAGSRGRKVPVGVNAWLSIAVFAIVDATCFQGFLAKGLEKTSAGLGSVIIDSQPLTVAVLASLLFGESISLVGVAGLVLGVVGLALLEGE